MESRPGSRSSDLPKTIDTPCTIWGNAVSSARNTVDEPSSRGIYNTVAPKTPISMA